MPHSTIAQLFTEKTQIDADYFLMEVLRVLGLYPDDDYLGSMNSTILVRDEKNVFGKIETAEKAMLIRRIENARNTLLAKKQTTGD